MSWISRLSAAALTATLLAATSAHAQTITPNPNTFTITGGMNIDPGVATCNFTMTFDVPAGGASATVTSAAITGGSSNCPAITFKGAPWNVRVGAGKLYVDNFDLFVFPNNPCGGGTLEMDWVTSATTNGYGFFYSQIGWCTVFGAGEVNSTVPIYVN
ncbi:hypothetical protein [Caulobacter endophyticus]|uniref:Protein activator of alkane oxidation PraB n=1 Tax=Caulobacter endophyticus TaxID=2172652 RepID=A0A2T9K798_9CAUL|nr:hypothetical protein [Caulobacter endophyticus]PVM91850.1 hypothetical protein DDF67_06325 [Caulobacter endophyticus]